MISPGLTGRAVRLASPSVRVPADHKGVVVTLRTASGPGRVVGEECAGRPAPDRDLPCRVTLSGPRHLLQQKRRLVVAKRRGRAPKPSPICCRVKGAQKVAGAESTSASRAGSRQRGGQVPDVVVDVGDDGDEHAYPRGIVTRPPLPSKLRSRLLAGGATIPRLPVDALTHEREPQQGARSQCGRHAFSGSSARARRAAAAAHPAFIARGLISPAWRWRYRAPSGRSGSPIRTGRSRGRRLDRAARSR